MKIAISVKNESLAFFGNAGHTPKFAIFSMNGSGMFRSFKLETIVNNPRTDLEHEHDEEEEGHHCSHGHDDAEHIAQHDTMGNALDGCDFLVAKKACKNTTKAMNAHNIQIIKYSGESTSAETILRELASKFIK